MLLSNCQQRIISPKVGGIFIYSILFVLPLIGSAENVRVDPTQWQYDYTYASGAGTCQVYRQPAVNSSFTVCSPAQVSFSSTGISITKLSGASAFGEAFDFSFALPANAGALVTIQNAGGNQGAIIECAVNGRLGPYLYDEYLLPVTFNVPTYTIAALGGSLECTNPGGLSPSGISSVLVTMVLEYGVQQQVSEISVESVQLAQVVYNPQLSPWSNSQVPYAPLNVVDSNVFNAVQGKSASFSPVVKLNNGNSILPTGTYQVQIQDANGKVISQSQRLDISTLSSGSYTITPDQMTAPSPLGASFIPTIAGPNALKAVVVSSSSSVTNKPLNLTMNVIKTYSPLVGLMRVVQAEPDIYLPVTDSIFNTFLNLSPYISDVFPVSDKSMNLLNMGIIDGNSTRGQKAKNSDLLALDRARRILGLNRAILVADESYLSFIGEGRNIGGVHPASLPYVAVVDSSELPAVPHELMHTFGVHYAPELYYTANVPHTFNGFDANPTGYLGHTQLFNNVTSFMDAFTGEESLLGMPWIDDRSYSIAFDYLQNPIIDPDTILISGILDQSGNFTSGQVYNLSNGSLTQNNQGGDLTFITFDKNGNALNSVTIQSDFTEEIAAVKGYSGPDIETVTEIPVAVEVSSNSNVAFIKIMQNNKEIFKSSVSGLQLIGIINRLPLAEFRGRGCSNSKDKIKFEVKEKAHLLQLANEAQKLMNSKHPESAVSLLDVLISEIKSATSNTYVAPNADALSQSDAISQIKTIIASLEDSKDCGKGK